MCWSSARNRLLQKPNANARCMNPAKMVIPGALTSLLLAIACLPPVKGAEEGLPAPVETSKDTAGFYFELPAPRGQILDSQGRALARMITVKRLMLQVPPLEPETPENFAGWVREYWREVAKLFPDLSMPDMEALSEHFNNRRQMPVPVSGVYPEDYVKAHPLDQLKFARWRVEYQREYPFGSLAAHAIGYVAPVGPMAAGPLHHGEPLWRNIAGKEGLEADLERDLGGYPGLLLMIHDKKTRTLREEIVIPSRPGRDVVTTLRIETQQSAEKALAAAKRPGALVVVNASTGDILALASAPTFDPGKFAVGMSADEFKKLTDDGGNPLVHRAVGTAYPPGSVIKPFVALACLRSGSVQPATRLLCGPELEIDGRMFGNWSETDAGMFDARAALVRSCNTYFYQAALATGSGPVLATLQEFGFGQRDEFPLSTMTPGTVPPKVRYRQALANLSIGQGDFLASPLQVSMAMAALARGDGRPNARLVAQVQDQTHEVLRSTENVLRAKIEYPADQLSIVREGLYGVVNHESGTATKARQENVRVFGKTGTAEWSNKGKRANVVWFGGFISDCNPPLAYAVALEGKPGEKVSGGLTAAPVMGQFLAEVFQNPGKHGITPGGPAGPPQSDPLITEPDPAQVPVLAGQQVLQPGSGIIGSNMQPLRAEPVYEDMPASGSVSRAAPAPGLTLTTVAPDGQRAAVESIPAAPAPAMVISEGLPVQTAPLPMIDAPPAVVETSPPPAEGGPAPPEKRGILSSLFRPKKAPKAELVEDAPPEGSAVPQAATMPAPVTAPQVPVAEPPPSAGKKSRKPAELPAPEQQPAPAVVAMPPQAPAPKMKERVVVPVAATVPPESSPAAPAPSRINKSKNSAAPPKAVAVDEPPAMGVPKALPADAAPAPASAPVYETPPPPPEAKPKFKLFKKSDDD